MTDPLPIVYKGITGSTLFKATSKRRRTKEQIRKDKADEE